MVLALNGVNTTCYRYEACLNSFDLLWLNTGRFHPINTQYSCIYQPSSFFLFQRLYSESCHLQTLPLGYSQALSAIQFDHNIENLCQILSFQKITSMAVVLGGMVAYMLKNHWQTLPEPTEDLTLAKPQWNPYNNWGCSHCRQPSSLCSSFIMPCHVLRLTVVVVYHMQTQWQL